MNRFFARLHARWRTAWKFAGAAQRWRDLGPLFLAGLARQRPFAGGSIYARLGRMLGTIVAPRYVAPEAVAFSSTCGTRPTS